MKHKIRIAGLIISLLLLLAGISSAQGGNATSTNQIIFPDGNAKESKGTALVNDRVTFIHPSETLNDRFNKKEDRKTEYAGARIEILTEKKELITIALPATVRNRVAVLPMVYIAEVSSAKMENMPFLLQEMTITFLSRSAAELKFMDPAETNALLLRAGINESNMRTYTPKELALLLHVEYIIMGTVMQDKGKIVSINHSHTQSRKNADRDWHRYKTRERRESHGSTVTGQQIENEVALSIYNNEGERIYNKSRHSLISDADGYKNTLRYLLKRTPLYER
jgi:hypothetical protein